jgi:hypothetical protein
MREWLTMFHIAVVVVDPFTWESSWVLETAGRVLVNYRDADCRIAWIVTGTADEAAQFLGPWSERILTFADPDREAVKALGLERLPAFVHINQDGTVAGAAEGWDPYEWRTIAEELSRRMSWSVPALPQAGDPGAFEGSPALSS